MNDSPPTDSNPPARERDYVVVARRYRPTTFGELIGQQQVSQALRNAIETHRVGHAYLFTGARGVGKTSTARIFGKALNCAQGPTAEPCNTCDICLSVASGDDVDVLEIDGASNRGIEEIRQLRSTVNVRPSRARFKIYIIDEVHMLTTPAFNALLKTLEEPPEHVKFIFCTTDPEKIPITVLSRCQRFDFQPVAMESIQKRLGEIAASEGVQADPEALAILARRAAGSMRDSQSLLEQLLAFCPGKIEPDDVHRLLGTAGGGRLTLILEALVQRHVADAIAQVDGAIQEGVDPGQLAEQLLAVLRDALLIAHGGKADLLLSQLAGDPERLQSLAHRWGAATILAAMQILDQTIARMRQSLHSRTLLEMAIVRVCGLGDLEAIDRLVRQLASGQPVSLPAVPAPAVAQSVPPKTPHASPQSQPVPAATTAPNPAHSPGRPANEGSKKKLATETQPDESPSQPTSLNAANAERLWLQTLEQIQDITSDFGRDYERVAISGPNTLVVTLKSTYNKEMCERADRRQRLEMALNSLTGQTIRIDFQAVQARPASTPTRGAVNRRQVMRDAQQHPWVNEALALFDGEVVDVKFRRRPD